MMMPSNAGCVLPAVLLAIVVGLIGFFTVGIVDQEIIPLPEGPLGEAMPPAEATVIVITPPPTVVPLPSPTRFPTITPLPTVTPPPTLVPTLAPDDAPTITPTTTPTATPSPSPTLEPGDVPEEASEDVAPVSITNVFGPGDLAAEAVEIVNDGALVDLGGWQIVAPDGTTFTFPRSAPVFPRGAVRVYTRGGVSTAIAYYWGLDAPLWSAGDTVTLLDAAGAVVSTFVIS